MSVANIFFISINLIAFLAFMIDKFLAKNSKRRISEATLVGLGLSFGATGAYLAMLLFRHKTQHAKFSVLMPVFMVLQLALFIWK